MSKQKQKSSFHSSSILCVFVAERGRSVAVLLFSQLNHSRSGYCISHSMEDWSAAVHWDVQIRRCCCSLSRHFPLSLSVSVSHLSLTRFSLTEAFLQYILSPSQWMLCRARKVITRSSSLTPRGQIEPFVVHIKAITLPHGRDGVGEGGWLVDDKQGDNCYQPLHPDSRLPGVRRWWPFMSVLTLVCLCQCRCGEARVRATKHPVIWTELTRRDLVSSQHTWGLKFWGKSNAVHFHSVYVACSDDDDDNDWAEIQ